VLVGQKFSGRYRYVLLNNAVRAAPKMGQMSESGTFPECIALLVTRFLCHPCIREKFPDH